MRRVLILVLLALPGFIHGSDFSGTWIGTWEHQGESQGVCLYLEQDDGLNGRIAYRHDTRVLPFGSTRSGQDLVEFVIDDPDRGAVTVRLKASRTVLAETTLEGTASTAWQSESIRLEKYSVPPIYYRYGKGRVEPVAIRTSRPEYTAEARAAKLQGTVSLLVSIESSGMVGADVQILQGLGLGLDEEAVKCVKKWQFSPPRYDCSLRAFRLRIEVQFVLVP